MTRLQYGKEKGDAHRMIKQNAYAYLRRKGASDVVHCAVTKSAASTENLSWAVKKLR